MLYISHMYSTVYMPFTVSPILCIACLCILRHSLQICTLCALNVIHSVSTSEKMDRLVHISLTSCQRTLCNSRRVKELERFSWMLLVNYTNFLCIPTMQNRQRYSNAINGRLIAIQGWSVPDIPTRKCCLPPSSWHRCAKQPSNTEASPDCCHMWILQSRRNTQCTDEIYVFYVHSVNALEGFGSKSISLCPQEAHEEADAIP